MAKKTGLENLFQRTEPGNVAARSDFDLNTGNIRATGVGLRAGELQALDIIGAEMGELLGTEPIARNAIMRLLIRQVLEAYQAGDITAADLIGRFSKPDKPKAKLKL